MPRCGKSFAGILIVVCFLAGAKTGMGAPEPAPDNPGGIVAGVPLTEALLALQARGLPLLFSSRVVLPGMTVVATPAAADPRSILDEILAPHGLAVEEQPGGSLVVVPDRRPAAPAAVRGTVRSRLALTEVPGVVVSVAGRGAETVTDARGRFEITGLAPGVCTLEARRPGFVIEQIDAVLAPGGTAEVSFVLQPAPLAAEEITVHPSRISLLSEEPAAAVALSHEEILDLPHLGGDVFRAVSLLPGISSNDVTAQFHVRGGRRDEVLVLLDGQELYEAFHLKDYDNALSIVPAAALGRLDLTTGAFPASYGGRMGAILDMSTVTPARPRWLHLSAGVLDLQVETAGRRGALLGWLVSARRGNTDLAGRVVGQENPGYWDLFGKVDAALTEAQSVRGNGLYAADRLNFTGGRKGETRRLDTDYGSSYLWLTHQAVLGERLFVDTALSTSRIDRDRRGGEDEEEKEFDVRDGRRLDVTGLLQSWNLQAGPLHFVKTGFELRRFAAEYDYFSDRRFESPFAELRSEPRAGTYAFRGRFTDDDLGAYLSDRFRPLDRLTLELGARYDRHSLTRDRVWSPRASLAWGLGGTSVLRLGWGHYAQSQRASELMVEDGDTRFYRPERSAHWVAGFEHLFANGTATPRLAVRAEVYRRRVTTPRPRYESLFEPFETFPEGELDRHRIVPTGGTAQGFELFVQRRSAGRFGWWANYTYATAEDEIAGAKAWRQIDQRHALNLDLNAPLGRHWNLNLAWRFHTGRPTTPVFVIEREGEDGETERVPVLGRINSERLPVYHRLDLRLSRKWPARRGALTLFFDVQNLYNRQNVAGYDLEIDEDAGRLLQREELWPGFFASAGISWEL